MSGLPKLPGLTFTDPTITKFHVNQTFDFINGYRIPKNDFCGIGGKELDSNSCLYRKDIDPIRYDPSLTYGRVKAPPVTQFVPHYAHYNQKCLTFRAFFKQSVFESPDEHYRIRKVNIIYFLEDDSITVMEPFVRDAGFMQGRLIRRGKLPKSKLGDFWHWKDFNVGIDVTFNGIVYHIVDCDGYTREYMASQGIIINPTEDMPPDPYTQMRQLKVRETTRVTPPLDDKLRRFLEYDGKILKFKAAWDNRAAEFGELKEYEVLYFLSDDSVSVKEVHYANDGCDPCPLLLRKTKLPKNWKDRPIHYPAVFLELSDAEVSEYYQPKDFIIGETIYVMGRRFLLYDCDAFTRNYFQKILNITQGPPIEVFEKEKDPPGKCMPPHGELQIGTVEDSLQNCFMTIPAAPKRDEVRLITNANKYLRYSMELDWVHPEDSIRKFLLIYSLAKGTCEIFEPPIPNSGILGGKFFRDSYLQKPESHPYNPEFYTPADFSIGAVVIVNAHRFIITGADLQVYRYMQANPEKFPKAVIDNVRNYMFNQGFLKDDLAEKVGENAEKHRKEEIDLIGKELKVIKTEREKCLEQIEANLAKADLRKDQEPEVQPQDELPPTETEQLNMVQDTQNLPYDKEICAYGVKPVVHECPYPVRIGDKSVETLRTAVCPDNPDSYTVKYPETEEQKLQKYYDAVLRRHEDACMRAEEYKKTHECLPGTVFPEHNPELSKYILVSPEQRPQAHKDSPCVKKTVRFAEAPDKLKQEKDDICNERIPRTTRDCSDYKPS